MAGEVRTVNNAPDQKLKDGRWVKYWSEILPEGKVGFHTRGSRLWRSLVARTEKEGDYQRKFTTYQGCSNGFTDFQTFMGWATVAPGYLGVDERGKYYCLDKDILVPGNKIYSPEFCRFVPNSLNMLLTDTQASRGEWPVGVHYHKARRTFRAQVKRQGRTLELGEFRDPQKAHQAWQLAKAGLIIQSCETWRSSPFFQQDVEDALLRRADSILMDLESGKITHTAIAFRGDTAP